MTRHARLALPENLRDLPNGQFDRAEQSHDPQPGRIGQRLKDGFDCHDPTYKDIDKSVNAFESLTPFALSQSDEAWELCRERADGSAFLTLRTAA